MATNIKSANNVSGYIIYLHCLNKYAFRVYNKDNTFTDYDINHCDLAVTIHDQDAFFYSNSDNKTDILDHAPATIGK